MTTIEEQLRLFEAPLTEATNLQEMAAFAKAEGFPAFISWSQELEEGKVGYLLEARGSRRALAVIEISDSDEISWLADTFRVRRDRNKEDIFAAACMQMMTEVQEHQATQAYIEAMIRKLYMGYGMVLQYPNVIAECNNPNLADTHGDAFRLSFGEDESSFNASDEELATSIRRYFEGDPSTEATLAQDAALHMIEVSKTLLTQARGVNDSVTVYRSRLSGYPWAYKEDHTARTKDIIAIKVNDGSLWFVSKIDMDIEADETNLRRFMGYGDQVLPTEALPATLKAILKQVSLGTSKAQPNHLMADLLEREKDACGFFESDDSPEINPYDLIN